ncbi:hypothetical protein HK096_003632 [Nowakowskiella sp. JEL0078]|nr:hypothetical protein HK096_003632 [Nowakowskiella sp. JEL0078]
MITSARPFVQLAKASQQSFSTSAALLSMIGRKKIMYNKDLVSVKVARYEPTASFPTCQKKIVVTGPLGVLEMPMHSFVKLRKGSPPPKSSADVDDDDIDASLVSISVCVDEPKERRQRQMWGTTRALLNSMIEGVTESFVLPIRFSGVGYRATLNEEERTLVLRLGYAENITLDVPEGVNIKVPQPQRILLQGIDKGKTT